MLILDLQGDLVCRAESNQRLPANASAELMQAAMKVKGHARKAQLAYRESRLCLHETPLDIMYRLAAGQRAAAGAAERSAAGADAQAGAIAV